VKNKLNITKEKVFNSIIIISFIVFLIIQYNGLQRETYLKSNCVFTVGKAIKYSGTDDGGNSYIEYKYYVGSLKYTNYVPDDYKMGSPLKKYFKVKYSKIKPEISEMYLTEEVIDSTQIVKAGLKFKNK
jgi:hypothetical protein